MHFWHYLGDIKDKVGDSGPGTTFVKLLLCGSRNANADIIVIVRYEVIERNESFNDTLLAPAFSDEYYFQILQIL